MAVDPARWGHSHDHFCALARNSAVLQEGASMAVSSGTAATGQPAPDFTLVDQHGAEFRLSAVLAERVVVLVFLRGFG